MRRNFSFLILVCLLLTSALIGPSDTVLAQTAPQQENTAVFTGRDAAATIAEAIAKEGGGNDIKVSISEAREDDTLVQAAGPITAETDRLEIDKAHNRWQALLLIKANDHNLAPLKLSGRYDEMTSIPVLKHYVQAGAIINEQDIDWEKEPAAHLRKNTVTDIHDLLGKSPKHMISQNRAIRLDEIASPAIINKGAQVTLLYKSPTIEIKTYGEAMEAGAKGEVIKVRNTTSKAVIQGVVVSGEIVRVSSPENDSAEALQ